MKKSEIRFNSQVRNIINWLERILIKDGKLPFKTTKDFAEYFKFSPYFAYRILRTAADWWNGYKSPKERGGDISYYEAKTYGVMFDCDPHGWNWHFFKKRQDLRDLCWIAAIRTHSHNKRALSNFGRAQEIEPDVKADVQRGQTEIIIPRSVKNYEDNIEED